MNTSVANQSMIGIGLRGLVPLSQKRCISKVKEQKTIMMSAGDGYNFDYVGNESVSQEEIF